MLADKEMLNSLSYTDKEVTNSLLLASGWTISVWDLVWQKEIQRKSYKIDGKVPLLLQILG